MRKLCIMSDCGVRVPPLETGKLCLQILPKDASGAERLEAIREAEVIIGEPTVEELRCAHKLRWLQMTWAGADRYLKGDFPSNVLLTTASGAFGVTIAEHAIGMLLALCRRLPAYHRWEDLGSEKLLQGGTALIYGCGDIGGEIAKRLKAFGVSTVGVCRNARSPRANFDILTTLDCGEVFFPVADFILCALPHSTETAGYFNAQRLSRLKDDAVLVNVGRGSFIVTQDLTEQLNQGRFFGVGLDVVEPEPLEETHPLWHMDRMILTPHVAGIGFGHLTSTEEKIWQICQDNLFRYLTGQPLKNLVKLP